MRQACPRAFSDSQCALAPDDSRFHPSIPFSNSKLGFQCLPREPFGDRLSKPQYLGQEAATTVWVVTEVMWSSQYSQCIQEQEGRGELVSAFYIWVSKKFEKEIVWNMY